ncbi:MAG: glycosyltransferase family 2 protein [Lentisphaerae bacterium]|nr:glycosyltransferase family 2 protein [Lentisphaerota bacterium]
MKLVYSLPALNEERTISSVLKSLPKNLSGIDEIICLVVNDGSIDKTAEIASDAGAIVLTHASTRGVGAAFHTGKNYALSKGADIVVTIDADGQFNVEDVPALIAPIVEGKADFVTGTRFADPDNRPEMPIVKYWGNMMMCHIVNALAKTSLSDVSCGFRAYSCEALLRLNLFGDFTYTQEVIMSLAFSDIRISELPITVRGVRQFGKSRVANNLVKYAIQTSKIIMRTYRDYRPLSFFMELCIVFFVPSLILAVFLFTHFMTTGQITPHKWAAFVSGGFFLISLQFAIVGILADMNNRTRSTVEEILVNQKRDILKRGS